MVDCIHQIAVKATPEAQGVTQERTMIEGNGAVERGAAVPGFCMGQYHDRCMKEKRVFSLLHLFIGIFHLGRDSRRCSKSWAGNQTIRDRLTIPPSEDLVIVLSPAFSTESGL
jgi:hypothetical protein